jgi:FKBP-type peptidyl-prolyl cis-trans isomerase
LDQRQVVDRLEPARTGLYVWPFEQNHGPKERKTSQIDYIEHGHPRHTPSAGVGEWRVSVSRMALAKYLKHEFDYENGTKLNAALKKAVLDGQLSQTGQSFRVVGDPMVERPPEPVVDIVDIQVGDGAAEATNGDTVVMMYEGKLADGTVFDAADTLEFTLGAGDVIKGWDQGILGMKVGGQRQLSVPSKLGYGKRGSAPDIPPNADLFFVVTLKKIRK